MDKYFFYIEYIVMVAILIMLTWDSNNFFIKGIPYFYMLIKSAYITYKYKHK